MYPVCLPSSRAAVACGCAPWDWPGSAAGAASVRLWCSREGLLLTGVLLGAQPAAPSSLEVLAAPRDPAQQAVLPGPTCSRPGLLAAALSQGRHLCCGGRMPCKQSAAAGNSRLGGLALCLTRT